MITGEVIMAHRPVMYGMAYKMINDRAVAEDVTDTAIEKAWVNRDSYDDTKAKPVTWLCQIVKNEALLHIRKASRLTLLDDYNLAAPEDDDVEEHYSEIKSRYEAVMDIVASDPYLQKYPGLDDAFISYYRDESGFSLIDLAEQYGINNTTIRTIFRRVKLRVIESLVGNVPNTQVRGNRAVVQYTLDGEYVNTYKHPSRAAECNGFGNSGGSFIRLCCDGVRTQYRQFVWEWAVEQERKISVEQAKEREAERRKLDNARRRVVDRLNDSGEVVATYDSPKAAAKSLGYQHRYAQFVRACANGEIERALGFRWQWTMKKKKK